MENSRGECILNDDSLRMQTRSRSDVIFIIYYHLHIQDVPTNLRAVKKAAKEVGFKGVLSKRNRGRSGRSWMNGLNGEADAEQVEAASGFADFILDYENETLGAYMK
jgi:hypothetical protein